jgi:hypothetical protein
MENERENESENGDFCKINVMLNISKITIFWDYLCLILKKKEVENELKMAQKSLLYPIGYHMINHIIKKNTKM